MVVKNLQSHHARNQKGREGVRTLLIIETYVKDTHEGKTMVLKIKRTMDGHTKPGKNAVKNIIDLKDAWYRNYLKIWSNSSMKNKVEIRQMTCKFINIVPNLV